MRPIPAAVLAGLMTVSDITALSVPVHAQAIIYTVTVVPPPLPIYVQPPIPAPDYLWVPGYWAWDDLNGYFWVPGTWIEPPRPGLLWTPGYWAWNNAGAYIFHNGYWGETVGFYGGVAYGYGYTGSGYEGGYWQGRNFIYNRTVTNITNVAITNVFTKTVVNTTNTRVSYNGGSGGLTVRPTPAQAAVADQPHVAPTQIQSQHVNLAQHNPTLLLSANGGRPTIAATSQATAFKGPGVASSASTPEVKALPKRLAQAPSGTPARPTGLATPAGASHGNAQQTAGSQTAAPVTQTREAPHVTVSGTAPHGPPANVDATRAPVAHPEPAGAAKAQPAIHAAEPPHQHASYSQPPRVGPVSAPPKRAVPPRVGERPPAPHPPAHKPPHPHCGPGQRC